MVMVVGNCAPAIINCANLSFAGCDPDRDKTQDLANGIYCGYYPTELQTTTEQKIFRDWVANNHEAPQLKQGFIAWGESMADLMLKVNWLRRQAIIPYPDTPLPEVAPAPAQDQAKDELAQMGL
jgi:hypothetical protein